MHAAERIEQVGSAVGLEHASAVATSTSQKLSVCAIGGAGILPSMMACTMSRPVMAATTAGCATPYNHGKTTASPR
jgi:hypothetical protein